MKRYNTETEILEAIDSCHKRAGELALQADNIAQECIKMRGKPELKEDLAYGRLEEKRLRGQGFQAH